MNSYSLRAKIMMMGLSISLASTLVMGFSLYKISQIEKIYSHVAQINLPNSEILSSMMGLQKEIFIEILRRDEENGKSRDSFIRIQELEKKYNQRDKQYQEIAFVDGEDELYKSVSKAWQEFEEALKQVQSLKKWNNDTLWKASRDFDEKIGKLIAFQNLQGQKWAQNAGAMAENSKGIQFVLMVLLFVLSVVTAFIFGSMIVNGIQAIVHRLLTVSNQLASSSEQIASASQGLSNSTTEQASALGQTASSLEEITSMITKASESAQTATVTSSESQQKAEEGRVVVDQMLTSMTDISESNESILSQVLEGNRQMAEIVKVIQDIGNRTKVINEIVFQTKLLSFNASVEAARAGEHGKGFAVVAEEVGNLAQMSGNAAKEITSLLDASITKVEGIVSGTKAKVEGLVQGGKEKVDQGVDVARQCSALLNEIVQNVARVSGLSQEISRASQEQSLGVGEINKAMAQLDTVTQQNASTSEENASAAEALSKQALDLKKAVEEIVYIIAGNQGAVRMDRPTPDSKSSGSSDRNRLSKKFISKPTAPQAHGPVSYKKVHSNVLPLKPQTLKKESTPFVTKGVPPAMTQMAASGESLDVPSRDHDGFRDI